jgi:hypothetical protein
MALVLTVETANGHQTHHRYPLNATTEQELVDLLVREKDRIAAEFESGLVSFSYPETIYHTAFVVAVRLSVGRTDAGVNAPESPPNPPEIGFVRNR